MDSWKIKQPLTSNLAALTISLGYTGYLTRQKFLKQTKKEQRNGSYLRFSAAGIYTTTVTDLLKIHRLEYHSSRAYLVF